MRSIFIFLVSLLLNKRQMRNEERIKHGSKRKSKIRKFVVVGPKGSGKKALINRFFGLPFDNKSDNENDIYKHKESYKGYKLKIQIAVIAETNNDDCKTYHIKTADVIILTYEYDSLESSKKLLELYAQLRNIREDKMPMIVVGTKSDLVGGASPITSYDVVKSSSHDSVKKIPGAKHIVTSSKYNINIVDVFNFCLSNAIKRIHTLSMSEERPLICKRKKASCWRSVFFCRNRLLCTHSSTACS